MTWRPSLIVLACLAAVLVLMTLNWAINTFVT